RGASARHRHWRDRARFPLRPQPARGAGAGLPDPHRGVPGERAAIDHSCPRGGCRDRPHPAGGTRDGRGFALLQQRPRLGRGGARSRFLHLDFGDRDLSQRRGIARDRARRTARPAAGRDRCALSRPGAVSRPAQRAGLCRDDRRGGGSAQGGRAIGVGGRDDRKFLPPVPQGGPAGRGMKVTVLGCGALWGVRAIGPDWGRCDPADPRNRRRRASLLIETQGRTILIDTSPDLREQLLAAGVSRLDAVLLTHAHADHLHGIDDLRMISQLAGHAIPFYAGSSALEEAERRFGYAFRPVIAEKPVYRPALAAEEIDGPFSVTGIPVVPFTQSHGFGETLGFRIGAVGYSTDVVDLDDDAFAALAGVELWVVDCLRREPHPTHAHLAKVIGWIERVRPHRAVLTHMDQSLDYRELSAELPDGVEPGRDGLVIELPEP